MADGSRLAPEKGGVNILAGQNRASRSRVRFYLFAVTLIILALHLAIYSDNPIPYLAEKLAHCTGRPTPQKSESLADAFENIEAHGELVPFEAHIMSKCPDAQVCLRDMVLPVMQRVISKVNFTLSYIGTPTENDGVECMHGAPECMGNILELCAAHLYPDPKIYLGFTMCLTQDYEDIPERSLVEDCALEHGIDFGELNKCASTDDGFAIGMLRDSVLRSSHAGITKSCTVRVNDEVYCVRDDGKWKECHNGPGVNDLVIAIEKIYSSL